MIIWMLKSFKRNQRQTFAKILAKLIFKSSKKTRNRAISNITLALPNLTETQVEKLALESYRNIVCGVLECFWLDELDIDIECDESTLQLLHNEKGAAVATMHMSCYEIAPVAIERLVGKVTTMSKIPSFVKSAADIYKKSNITVINAKDSNAFMQLLQATKKKNVICLHADHFSRNISMNFFGRATSAPSGIAMVSAYQKVPLLICYALLQENGRYKVVVETVNSGQVENNAQAITQAMGAIYHRFEKIIKTHPEQWYWSYNRWRSEDMSVKMNYLPENSARYNQHQKKKSWSRLFSYFSSHKLKIAFALLALCVFSIVDAGMIYFVKPLVDDGLAQSNSATLEMGALLVVVIFLARGSAGFVYNYMLSYVSNYITYDIRQQAFNKLQYLPMHYFDKCNRGTLISKLIYDTEQISKATSSALVTVFRESIIVLVLLTMMFYQSWKLSLIFVLIGPLIAFIVMKVIKRFKQVSIALQNSMGDITKIAEQSLTNHQEILAYNMANRLSKQFLKANNKNRQQMMKLATASALSNPTIQLIASFSISAVLLLASNESIIQELTPGTFTMVLFAIGSLLRPLKQLTTVNQQLQRGIAAANSIFELLDQHEEYDDGNKVLSGEGFSIEFKRLNFSYSLGASRTLNDISLVIPSKTSIAIVGETGSGKSTLANLLLRLYDVPDSSIYINNTPIEQYGLASLRANIALVSQQIVLFDDSLANNILFGCEREVTRAELENIAEKSNVMAFASSLPLGLDSAIGENGCLLSGGQRQRVAIARAMLKDAPIVILDEATSALDNKSEFLIQQAFNRLGVNKTMVIIAHRLSTIEKADQIIVLNQGRIVERGNHQTLLSNGSTYYEMHQQQFTRDEK